MTKISVQCPEALCALVHPIIRELTRFAGPAEQARKFHADEFRHRNLPESVYPEKSPAECLFEKTPSNPTSHAPGAGL